jgi:hypothetical protein
MPDWWFFFYEDKKNNGISAENMLIMEPGMWMAYIQAGLIFWLVSLRIIIMDPVNTEVAFCRGGMFEGTVDSSFYV